MRRALILGLLASASCMSAQAQTFSEALLGGKPLADLRARYEAVSDDTKTRDASALTLRARLGYETAAWNGLQLLAELDEIVSPSGTPYNSTRNGKTTYPVIADPAMTALNRLQLTYASGFDTKFVVGRQRLLIGNQRFVGNAGWRQHEQSFDALSVTNTAVPGLTATYAYLYRINRVNGPATPNPDNTIAAATGQAGHLKSDSHVLDAVYTGVPGLKLEAYAFLLDLSAPGKASLPAQTTAASRLATATYGGRADYTLPLMEGLTGKLTGEFARQTNYAGNPLSFALNYWLGEGGVTWGSFNGTLGYEVLEGNGSIGFATPLATLHAFNGWADLFLTTPVNGLKDFYLKTTYLVPADFIAANALNLAAAYHSFKSDALSQGIGTEWDLQTELVVDTHWSFLAKYADYAGSGTTVGSLPDKSIFWLQSSWRY